MHFEIIGAGIVGLTTALTLQKEFPNAQVSILADKFFEDTTSSVAAGVFRPGTSFCGPTEVITKKWIKDAYNYWDDIRKTSYASLAGVCQLSAYIFSKTGRAQVKNHYLEDVVPRYRDATEEELTLCNGGWKYGSYFTTILTDSKIFLPYAVDKFKSNGGLIYKRKINSFSELSGKGDVIFNCTGLGARDLCLDYKLVPIRGQVIKVKAPWIKMAFYGDYDTYIIPGFDGVTLGGCRQYDSYNTEVCKYDSAAIRERCHKMLPSLQKADFIRENVGLRPHREPVRVETELLPVHNGSGQLKIIHNYGHGGYGVTTSPGTAIYAVKLAKDILSASGKCKL